MERKNNPLTLTDLKLNVCCETSETSESLNNENFDRRHDFEMSVYQSAVAVLMTFGNERLMTTADARGIRRRVSVTLIDVKEERMRVSLEFGVYIPKGSYSRVYSVELPFDYEDSTHDRAYRVEVRDLSDGTLLGERELRLYDKSQCGSHPSEWYRALKACLIPAGSDRQYRSLDVSPTSFHRVRFYLERHFVNEPEVLPEVEFRLYYPDGEVESTFFDLMRGVGGRNEYYVEMPLMVSLNNQGVCYAEILLMDYPLAGFVFSTKGPEAEGYASGEQLECLDEYSPQSALKRFHENLKHAGI